jgi:hypothetical protein
VRNRKQTFKKTFGVGRGFGCGKGMGRGLRNGTGPRAQLGLCPLVSSDNLETYRDSLQEELEAVNSRIKESKK